MVGSILELSTILYKRNHQAINKFESKTRNLHHQEGIGTLTGLCFLMLCSMLFYYILTLSLTEYREFHNRKENYLCFNQYVSDLKQLTSEISKLNLSMLAVNAGVFTGVGATTIEAGRKIIFLLQESAYLSFLKKINKNSHCNLEQKAYLNYQFPYQAEWGVKIKTDPLGLTLIKENKWNLYFFRKSSQIRKSKIFVIQTELVLKNVFSTLELKSSKEIQSQDLLNWKPPFGFSYY